VFLIACIIIIDLGPTESITALNPNLYQPPLRVKLNPHSSTCPRRQVTTITDLPHGTARHCGQCKAVPCGGGQADGVA
jgi:hypothetical protein